MAGAPRASELCRRPPRSVVVDPADGVATDTGSAVSKIGSADERVHGNFGAATTHELENSDGDGGLRQ